uniref:DM domain-containing protein n=1 Tax=Pundamilia nyererei TaxID=303518 RepID=A0A3B4FCU1_9CICH
LIETVRENGRKPKCARCRHHGIIVPKKGHTKICPFLKCQCWKCYLITERTKIAALQREMKRAMKETRPGARRVNAQGDKAFGTSNPDGGAPSTSEPMCPPPGGSPEKGSPAYPWSRPEAGGQPESGCRDSLNLMEHFTVTYLKYKSNTNDNFVYGLC